MSMTTIERVEALLERFPESKILEVLESGLLEALLVGSIPHVPPEENDSFTFMGLAGFFNTLKIEMRVIKFLFKEKPEIKDLNMIQMLRDEVDGDFRLAAWSLEDIDDPIPSIASRLLAEGNSSHAIPLLLPLSKLGKSRFGKSSKKKGCRYTLILVYVPLPMICQDKKKRKR